jgi:hypothetical protein
VLFQICSELTMLIPDIDRGNNTIMTQLFHEQLFLYPIFVSFKSIAPLSMNNDGQVYPIIIIQFFSFLRS